MPKRFHFDLQDYRQAREERRGDGDRRGRDRRETERDDDDGGRDRGRDDRRRGESHDDQAATGRRYRTPSPRGSFRSGSRGREPEQRKGNTKPLQSGILAKSTDTVLYPQEWPHVAIHCDKIGENYSFHELDVRLFVTGELELIARYDITPGEHEGRLRLLRQLMYLSKVHDWGVILRLYSEVVMNIERGLLTWVSRFDETLTWAVARQVPSYRGNGKPTGGKPVRGKNQGGKSRPTYCKDFQSNACAYTEDKHWGTVNGDRMMVEHICAACLMKRKEVTAHSESSSDCPCRGSRNNSSQ